MHHANNQTGQHLSIRPLRIHLVCARYHLKTKVVYLCIEITTWLASAYDFYARVVKDC